MGNGIGLRQGDAIDEYADEATYNARREEDEKFNWAAITAENLNKYYAALSYFDAEGMRFHIPAFIIADIEGKLGVDPVFHLTQLEDYSRGKLTLLSQTQRAAIREYLLLIKDDPNYRVDLPHIEMSLRDYWTAD